MKDQARLSVIYVHDLSRKTFDSLPGQELRVQPDKHINLFYWNKTVDFEAFRIEIFTHEPPTDKAAPVCYICKTPVELEHATLCNDCAKREAARWHDYVNASKDERTV